MVKSLEGLCPNEIKTLLTKNKNKNYITKENRPKPNLSFTILLNLMLSKDQIMLLDLDTKLLSYIIKFFYLQQ